MSSYVPPTSPIGQPSQGPGGGPPPGYQGMPPQPPQQKSKAWIWVLSGCGAIILLGVIAISIIVYLGYRKAKEVATDMEKNPAMVVAKLAVAANPDLETVSVNEAKGTITVRDKKTGEVVTVDFDDVKDGKIVFKGEGGENVTIEAKGDKDSGSLEVKSDKGSMKFGAGAAAEELPGWLPSYPGAKAEGTYSMRTEGGNGGSFTFTTGDSVDKVIAFYETELKAAGLKVSQTTWRANGATAGGLVTAEDKTRNRTAGITATSKEGGSTLVSVTFGVKE